MATFNIRNGTARDHENHWRLRRESTRQAIAALPFDICGLQEVQFAQRRFLRDGLPGTQWFGVGRDDGARRGEQAPFVVRSGRIEVEQWATMWLSEQPGRRGSRGWDASRPRIATLLHGRTAAGPVGVINTHVDHRGEQAQLESAKLLAEHVKTDSSRRWIVMGDFNVRLSSSVMKPLLRAGLRSALPDDAGGTFHAWTGATDRRRIDHILVDAGWDVVAACVSTDRPGGVLPSDHWPVLAQLRAV